MDDGTDPEEAAPEDGGALRLAGYFLMGVLAPVVAILVCGAVLGAFFRLVYPESVSGWGEALLGGILMSIVLVTLGAIGITIKSLKDFDWKRKDHIAQAAGSILSMAIIAGSTRLYFYLH